MRRYLLTGSIFLACLGSSFAAPTKLAYEKADAVWVAKIDGSSAKKIADGASPTLSPDEAKLAFNTQQPIGQPAHRKIAVCDLTSGDVKILEDIPSDNCLEPTWSPDGKRILFYLYVNNEMRIGSMNADGSRFKFVQPSAATHHDYFSATWARDGQSLFAQDMIDLYQLGLDGSVLKKWKIEKLIPHGGMSGNVRLNVSPDGKTLLLDVEMNEKERKGWDGPPPSIWTMDLATEKVARLTPKTLYAWDSCWLGSDAVLFAGQEPNEKEPSIYRMSLGGNGQDRKLLVKDARLPSVAQ